MKRITLVLAGIFILVSSSRTQSPTPPPHLRVCLYSAVRIPADTISVGKTVARDIFAKSGIDVEWTDVTRGGEGTPETACQGVTLILAQSQPSAATDSLAEGATIEGKGWVFYDRVESYTRAIGKYVPLHEAVDQARGRVLGTIMSHEIGHILKLTHSPDGIMRATWAARDFSPTSERRLTFTSQESQKLITILTGQALDRPRPGSASRVS